jgi:hypothetical protein
MQRAMNDADRHRSLTMVDLLVSELDVVVAQRVHFVA